MRLRKSGNSAKISSSGRDSAVPLSTAVVDLLVKDSRERWLVMYLCGRCWYLKVGNRVEERAENSLC